MDISVKSKESFSVIGRQGQGPPKFAPVWVRPLWKDLQDNAADILHLVKRFPDGQIAGIWGLMSDSRKFLAPWGVEGRYLAGYEALPGASPPRGWSLWSLPTQTYLVVPCSSKTYQSIYDHILHQLQDDTSYRLAGAVQEHYPLYANPGEMELHVPVAFLNPSSQP